MPLVRTLPALLALTPLVALCLACSSGGARDEAERSADPTSRRALTRGEVLGFTTGQGAHAWLGLPFAKPPTGERRWRAPEPPASWSGVREALSAAAPCPQFAGPLAGVEGEGVVGDEDCLYYNVFAPHFDVGTIPTGDARLPVMFWIHGGGNSIGTGATYDGSRLAVEQNVIVVTTNYRLGALGWFRHPALVSGARDERDASGNYGTLDLIRALEQVQEDIAAFGGDPGNVTIFGESAGGHDVYTLLVAPGAKGLFHRAISQSGGHWTVPLVEAEAYADAGGAEFSSREVVLRLLERDGVDKPRARADALSTSETAALLRGKSTSELLGAYEADPGFGMYRPPMVFRDGSVLPTEAIADDLAAGRFHRVPVMLGTNRDETKLFMASSPEHVWRLFWLFPILRDAERYDRDAQYGSQLWKVDGVDAPATAMVEAGHRDVFAYRFDWDEQGRVLVTDVSRLIGAGHGLEIPFVFDSFGSGMFARIMGRAEDPARDALGRAMRDYWAEFARHGDPGAGGRRDRPRWERWSNAPDAPKFAILDTPADGGVRMSRFALTRAGVLDALAADARFADADERCGYMKNLVRFADLSAEEYTARGCGAWPPAQDVAAR